MSTIAERRERRQQLQAQHAAELAAERAAEEAHAAAIQRGNEAQEAYHKAGADAWPRYLRGDFGSPEGDPKHNDPTYFKEVWWPAQWAKSQERKAAAAVEEAAELEERQRRREEHAAMYKMEYQRTY